MSSAESLLVCQRPFHLLPFLSINLSPSYLEVLGQLLYPCLGESGLYSSKTSLRCHCGFLYFAIFIRENWHFIILLSFHYWWILIFFFFLSFLSLSLFSIRTSVNHLCPFLLRWISGHYILTFVSFRYSKNIIGVLRTFERTDNGGRHQEIEELFV